MKNLKPIQELDFLQTITKNALQLAVLKGITFFHYHNTPEEILLILH